MAGAAYTFEVDCSRTGLYNHALSNLTGRLVGVARWHNGMADSYGEIAPPSTLSVTLDNADGQLSPEDTTAAYYGLFPRGVLCRLRATFQGTTVQLYEGKLNALTLAPGWSSNRTAALSVEDQMSELSSTEYQQPVQLNVRTDQVIQNLFEKALLAYPYPSSYWLLGAVGSSELGTTTRLFDISNHLALSQGKTTLAYAGDNLDQGFGVPALTVIQAMVYAEAGGRFYWDTRTSKWTFHDRQYDARNMTDYGTFTDADYDPASDYRAGGDDLINRIEIGYEPRSVSGAGVVLWESDSVPFEVGAQDSRMITGRYRDLTNEGARVGGMDIIAPAAGVDYLGNSASDGTGTNLTASLNVNAYPGATSCQIKITNNTDADIYVTRLQIRGTAITAYNVETVQSKDVTSIAAYGYRGKTYNAIAMSDAGDARRFADHVVATFKDPIPRFAAINVRGNDSDALMTHVLNRTVGQQITITNSFLNHDKAYVIVAEDHTVTFGGEHTHDVTWALKPFARIAYWVLGVTGKSELGTTTRLAF